MYMYMYLINTDPLWNPHSGVTPYSGLELTFPPNPLPPPHTYSSLHGGPPLGSSCHFIRYTVVEVLLQVNLQYIIPHAHLTLYPWILTRVARVWWSDVLRSNDDGIGMTVGLELSQPARQCDGRPTESVGSKLERLWGLKRYGERRDDRGTLTLGRKIYNKLRKSYVIFKMQSKLTMFRVPRSVPDLGFLSSVIIILFQLTTLWETLFLVFWRTVFLQSFK